MTDQTVDRAYIDNLRQTSIGLMMQASEADRRGIPGLAHTLTTTAAAAARWANALEETTK